MLQKSETERQHAVGRWVFFGISLWIMAYGVALSIKAGLGTSPISTLPYVVSLFTPFTVGNAIIICHCIFILLQILILRKDYQPLQLLQLPAAVGIGYLVDFSLMTLQPIAADTYWEQWLLCAAGIALVAVGVSGAVASHTTVLALEGLALAICQKTRRNFSNTKIAMDITVTMLAILLSLLVLHRVEGAREGTIAAMIGVGFLTKFLMSPITRFENLFLKPSAS